MSTAAAWATKQGLSTADGAKALAASSNPRPIRLLTFREVQVVEWIAAGKRDREIGQILNISSRTIQKHVQHILEKLEVETRGAATTAWYQRRQ